MRWLALLLDRTAILFLGVAAGVAIGYAFGTGGARKETIEIAPSAPPIAQATPEIAPPPPSVADAAPKPGLVAPPPPAAPIVAGPPSAGLVDAVQAGRTIRIGVFGDSFGDGVWSALYRLLSAKDGYQVVKFSQQSTGFTRYRRLNLEEHDDSQIADSPVEIAVISFGANDAQGVCDGGKCGALMGPYWRQVIGARVESYVAMLRRHGASVYWVGLPAMRDTSFDGDARAMDAFYEELMQRLSVPFLDIRPLTVDAEGRYQAYYADADGSQKQLRAGDGIHMSMNGYLRIGRPLAGQIRASVAAARAEQPARPAPADPETVQ